MRTRAIAFTSRAGLAAARGLGRVAVRLGRQAEALGHRVTGGPPVAARRRSRLAAAMDVVARVEALDPELTRARSLHSFQTVDRVALRRDLDTGLMAMLPSPLQGDWAQRSDVSTSRFPVSADVVVLAKFDLHEQVKLRAGYGASRRTLAVQPVRPNGTCGVTNAVESHRIVSRYAPGLMPTVRSHGELPGGLRWLVEDWVEGEVALTSQRLAAHVPHLLEALGKVHLGYGVHGRRVSDLWGRGYAERWQAVRDLGLVGPYSGAAVARLIADDRRMRMSWSHGDLVASNVLASPTGPVVIDWEHAGERPVVHDAAKLHLFAADKEPLLDLLLAEWAHTSAGVTSAASGGAGYTAAEELALMHAKFLTAAPARMARLSGHGREGVYARQVSRQAALLDQVVARQGLTRAPRWHESGPTLLGSWGGGRLR